MNRSLFTRIVRDLSANCPYFQEGCDAVGKAGILCFSEVYLRDSLNTYLHYYGEEYCEGLRKLTSQKRYAFHRRTTWVSWYESQHRLYKMSRAQCSNNDVNVLRQSPVLNDLKVGKAPENELCYEVLMGSHIKYSEANRLISKRMNKQEKTWNSVFGVLKKKYGR
ncbi:hypothetical protein Tco_0675746 [Tanacetum coccineum]